MKMENWCVCSTDNDPYLAPECVLKKLRGNVYGNPKFGEGDLIVSSPLVELDLKENRAVTKSGSVYELGEVDQEWIKRFVPSPAIGFDGEHGLYAGGGPPCAPAAIATLATLS